MRAREIGRFYATTFDEMVIEFIVYEDGIECPLYSSERYFRVDLKPRFVMIKPKKYFTYQGFSLIRDYDIDDDLFVYMKEKSMIMYSTDMAYLYGFSDKHGYDSESRYCVKRPFKRAMKKGPILVKQRQGQFN